MDAAAKRLLLEALSRERTIAGEPVPGRGSGTHKERMRQALRQLAYGDQVEYGPRWSSRDWLGAATPAEQMAAGRLLKRIEAAGLVVVRRLGGQAHNVKLTDAGREMAKEAAADAAQTPA